MMWLEKFIVNSLFLYKNDVSQILKKKYGV